MPEPLKWYDEKADNSPWINALAEVRQRAAREHIFATFAIAPLGGSSLG
ncbi:hypothetical protein [Bradyrhizobium sp. RDI18]